MNTRVLKLATAMALVASIASVATASAARYTGADYCAVQNNGAWSLIGGGSCNPNPGQGNSDWTQSFILDFDGLRIVNASSGAQVGGTFGSLTDMLTELSANYASHDQSGDWMYVANKKGNQDAYVYLLVPESSCSGASEWAYAPACD